MSDVKVIDQVAVARALLRRAADQTMAYRTYLDSLDCESACGGECRRVNAPCVLAATRKENEAVLRQLTDAAR